MAPTDRLNREFDTMMRGHVADDDCRWIGNEAPQVLPSITATGPEVAAGRLVLGLDGRSMARTQGHGRSFGWHCEL